MTIDYLLENLKKSQPIQLLGHDNADFDSISSMYLMQKLLDFSNIESIIVIPDGKIPKEFDFNKYNFEYTTTLSEVLPTFLVDHDKSLHKCNVIGCIDHHARELTQNGLFYNKPQTSCAKIIFDYILQLQIDDKNLTELTVKSLYLDSLSFLSKKAIQKDKDWADEMCKKYNLDKITLYNEGLMLTDISNIDQDTISNEFKEFNINNNKVGTSCAKLKKEPSQEIIDKMLSEVNFKQNIKHYDYWMYYLTCIEDNKTIVFLSNKDTTARIDFDGLKSRGKDLKPILENKIPKKEIENIINTEHVK